MILIHSKKISRDLSYYLYESEQSEHIEQVAENTGVLPFRLVYWPNRNMSDQSEHVQAPSRLPSDILAGRRRFGYVTSNPTLTSYSG